MPGNPVCSSPVIPCECCAEGYPKTLYLTFTSATCGINRLVIPVTNVSNNCIATTRWTGDGSQGGCELHAEVWVAVNFCGWRLFLNNCVGETITLGPAECPFVTVDETVEFNCPCCDEHSVTITLSA